MIICPIFPVGAIMGELDGELLVGSYWGNLDDVDAVPMEREFAVVMV